MFLVRELEAHRHHLGNEYVFFEQSNNISDLQHETKRNYTQNARVKMNRVM